MAAICLGLNVLTMQIGKKLFWAGQLLLGNQ